MVKRNPNALQRRCLDKPGPHATSKPLEKSSGTINSPTPISTLATELLTKVLTLVAMADYSISILQFSHVSQRFRNITLNTPLLWTNLCISEFQIHSEELLDLYLARSQVLLLDIKLKFSSGRSFYYASIGPIGGSDGDGDYDEDEDEGNGAGWNTTTFPLLFKILTLNVARWHRLSLTSSGSCTPLGMVMNCLAYLRAPRLESFDIDILGRSGDDYDDFSYRPLQKGAPLLSSITLRGSAVHLGYPPLKSVKYLNIDLSYTEQALEFGLLRQILRQSKSLTKLVIVGQFDFECENPVTMPSLLSLDIISSAKGSDLHILSLIEAPLLDTLSLQITSGFESYATILEQLPNRFPCLGKLQLDITGVYRNRQLRQLHNMLPDVTSVCYLFSNHSIWEFLEASNGVHWPKLKSIAILSPRTHKQPWDLICTVITSRAAAGHPISELHIHPSMLDQFPEHRKWLQERVKIFA